MDRPPEDFFLGWGYLVAISFPNRLDVWDRFIHAICAICAYIYIYIYAICGYIYICDMCIYTYIYI